MIGRPMLWVLHSRELVRDVLVSLQGRFSLRMPDPPPGLLPGLDPSWRESSIGGIAWQQLRSARQERLEDPRLSRCLNSTRVCQRLARLGA
jgi:hypothetical protein